MEIRLADSIAIVCNAIKIAFPVSNIMLLVSALCRAGAGEGFDFQKLKCWDTLWTMVLMELSRAVAKSKVLAIFSWVARPGLV